MNRLFLTLLLIASVAPVEVSQIAAQPKSRTESVVNINGARYYVHEVVKGDTMYGLSKRYGVTEKEIFAANPILGNGLKTGLSIKIPVRANAAVGARNVSPTQSSVAATPSVIASDKRAERGIDAQEVVRREYGDGDVVEFAHDSGVDSLDMLQAVDTLRGVKCSELNTPPAGLRYYTVQAGDNFNSVAEAHEMSVERLKRLNHIGAGERLETDRKILVRSATSIMASRPYTESRKREIESRIDSVYFMSLSPRDTLNVALLLPLSVNGRTMQPFVEFYQGVLLGVEHLRDMGRSVVLNLYNTERNATRVRNIISDPSYRGCELIIGPVYENLLTEVLEDAERRSIPVVSPLATIETKDSPVLFQMAPDSKNRFDKMDDLLGADRRVTLIEGETNDESFRKDVLKLLASRDVEYFMHEYEYEHPSLIDDRKREADKRIKALREAAEEAELEFDEQRVVDSLTPKPSKSDLTPLLLGEEVESDLSRDGLVSDMLESDSVYLNRLIDEQELALASAEAKDEDAVVGEVEELAEEEKVEKSDEPIHHTLFVLSNDEVEVDRILSALSSAYAAQIAMSRGSGRNFREWIQYEVVANPEWRKYKNIDRAVYFRNKVVSFSSYLADRSGENIRHFDSMYSSAFGELPSLYSYRGFDAMLIFGEGMYSDILYEMGGRTYQPLQSKYRFERGEERTAIVNTNWMREGYNTNFTKEIE